MTRATVCVGDTVVVMKYSFCSIGFKERPIESVISMVAQAGYDGIEIWGPHIRDVESINNYVHRHNLFVPMLSPYFDVVSSRRQWRETLVRTEQFIEYACAIGSPFLRGLTGGRVSSNMATPEQWAYAVEGYKKICAMAAEKEITIAIETHARNLTDTIASAERFVGDVGAPNLKINLDVFHLCLANESWIEAVDTLWKDIVHVHLKNWRGTKHTALPEGELDISSFLSRLSDRGYTGWVSVEWPQLRDEQFLRDSIQYLRKLEDQRAQTESRNAHENDR